MENVQNIKEFSREQLEAELEHTQLLVQNLTRANGEMNTELLSKTILNKQLQDKVEKMEKQMLDYVEKSNQPTQVKTKK